MMKRFLVITLAGITLMGCANISSLSGDVYRASEAKQVRTVAYGTIVSLRPVQIQSDDENSIVGTIGGAVLGGFLGNTIGGGAGRSLAAASGALAGGVAGQSAQGVMNRNQGVELEIRCDDSTTIMVVQYQGNTRFSVGQRVAMSSNGQNVTVSPR
ncbi:MAG: glycine zipper 2TM domain-containing protein [Candidatus Malihini olakiniferum]